MAARATREPAPRQRSFYPKPRVGYFYVVFTRWPDGDSGSSCCSVTDVHPFVWLKREQEASNEITSKASSRTINYQLTFWTEITRAEYTYGKKHLDL